MIINRLSKNLSQQIVKINIFCKKAEHFNKIDNKLKQIESRLKEIEIENQKVQELCKDLKVIFIHIFIASCIHMLIQSIYKIT